MKSFWQFLGALILLIVAGSIIYQIVYALRTGRDPFADRMAAFMAANRAGTPDAQPKIAVVAKPEAQPVMTIDDL